MTHFIFSNWTLGDVLPLLEMAVSLKKCGHEVYFCAPPKFKKLILSNGIGFVASLQSEDEDLLNNHFETYQDIKQGGSSVEFQIDLAGSERIEFIFDQIFNLSLEVDFVWARFGSTVEAVLIAKFFQVKVNQVVLTPSYIAQFQIEAPLLAPMMDRISKISQKIDFNLCEDNYEQLILNNSDFFLMWPKWFYECDHSFGDEVRYMGFSKLHKVKKTSTATRLDLSGKIVVSGSRNKLNHDRSIQTFLKEITDQDVILVGQCSSYEINESKNRIERIDYLDHRELGGCKLFVNHGGIGSIISGFQNNVPQLILPDILDRPLNARIAARAKMATTVSPGEKLNNELIDRCLAASYREAQLEDFADFDSFGSMVATEPVQERAVLTGEEIQSSNRSLVDLLKKSFGQNREKIAIRYMEDALTYFELEEMVREKIRQLCHKDQIFRGFYLLLDRSPDSIALMLAAIFLGVPFIPIDKSYPARRIEKILDQVGAKYLYTDEKDSKRLSTFREKGISIIRKSSEQEKGWEQDDLPDQGLDTLLYILFTSGSSGEPKGVKITHGNILNFLLGVEDLGIIRKEDQVLAHTRFSFDISYLEVFSSFTAGASIVLASDRQRRSPEKMVELLNGEVTVFQSTPSLLDILLLSNWTPRRGLKVLVGGEPINEAQKEKLLAYDIELTNMYGPTEATIWVTSGRLAPKKNISIGKPMANVEISILDDQKKICKVGQMGEIVISGNYVSPGYLMESMDQGRFVKLPWKDKPSYFTGDLGFVNQMGEIECKGRLDSQVKLNGNRIELEEIENSIMEYLDVSQAKVLKISSENGPDYLAAFVKAPVFDGQALKKELSNGLPWYMVPSSIIRVGEFPLNHNGKLDASALLENEKEFRKLSKSKEEKVLSLEDVKKTVSKHWEEILQTSQFDSMQNESFFNLGGDSLSGLELINKIENSFGMRLGFQFLVEKSSIRLQAEYLFTKLNDNRDEAEVIDPWRPTNQLQDLDSIEHIVLKSYEELKKHYQSERQAKTVRISHEFYQKKLRQLSTGEKQRMFIKEIIEIQGVSEEQFKEKLNSLLNMHTCFNSVLVHEEEIVFKEYQKINSIEDVSLWNTDLDLEKVFKIWTEHATVRMSKDFFDSPLFFFEVFIHDGKNYLFLVIDHLLGDANSQSIITNHFHSKELSAPEKYLTFLSAAYNISSQKIEQFKGSETFLEYKYAVQDIRDMGLIIDKMNPLNLSRPVVGIIPKEKSATSDFIKSLYHIANETMLQLGIEICPLRIFVNERKLAPDKYGASLGDYSNMILLVIRKGETTEEIQSKYKRITEESVSSGYFLRGLSKDPEVEKYSFLLSPFSSNYTGIKTSEEANRIIHDLKQINSLTYTVGAFTHENGDLILTFNNGVKEEKFITIKKQKELSKRSICNV